MSHIPELFPQVSCTRLIFHANVPKTPNKATEMRVFKVEARQSPATRSWFSLVVQEEQRVPNDQ